MVQNLKVDIIYHLTPSDFEMEFNLCGCCRMRLLNDKTTDKKTFIKALARAVSRSRVIIACGPLFGADGLIKTVAAAIGSKTVLCDNSTYGISGEEQIDIINGSTPLVTPDGYFGGCIIESGPQTIILLTENRGFRKTIMQNLIHPYIEEISYIPIQRADTPDIAQQEVAPSEDYLTEPDTDYGNEKPAYSADGAEIEFEPQNEHNIDFIMDESPDGEPTEEETEPLSLPTVDETFDDMYIETEPEDQDYGYGYTSSGEDDMFIAKTEEEPEKPKRKFKAMDISIVVLVLILLLAVLSLVYFVILKPYTMGISTGDYLKQIFSASSNNSLL